MGKESKKLTVLIVIAIVLGGIGGFFVGSYTEQINCRFRKETEVLPAPPAAFKDENVVPSSVATATSTKPAEFKE